VKPTLDDLIALLARGVLDASFTGTFEQEDGEGRPRRWRVWRRGRLARIEEPPGTMTLIAGHRTYWRKWPIDPAVVAIPRSPDYDDFELSMLTMLDPHAYWREWLSQDPELVLSSLASTTHEGRAAWCFDAPEKKGGSPTVTVDAELGLVLSAERADIGVFRSWTQVRTDVDLNDEVFHYAGPWELASDYAYPEGWLPE
jgi:hypothetical protein